MRWRPVHTGHVVATALAEVLDDRPYRLRMGLRPLEPGVWLVVDGHYDDELAEKRRLLAEGHGDVVATVPGSEAAAAEVLDEVLAALRALDAERFADPAIDSGLHPIDAAGRLVQEDLCLHEHVDGRWVLTAASVCFPTRWTLADKIGRSVAAIHDPVPGYGDELASVVDGFFDRLRPGPGYWRRNWSLVTEPDLYLPERDTREPVRFGAEAAGERVWVRSERQTLRRLPGHGSIVFTIRVERWPLGALTAYPELAARLASAVRRTPPAMAAYKSLDRLAPVVLPWLDRVASS